MGPTLQVVLTLAADGQIGIKAEGPLADDRALVAWLLRSAETAVLDSAAKDALAKTCSPLAIARVLPPLPNGHRR